MPCACYMRGVPSVWRGRATALYSLYSTHVCSFITTKMSYMPRDACMLSCVPVCHFRVSNNRTASVGRCKPRSRDNNLLHT